MQSLVIVQPYVPTYRVRFFDGLSKELERSDIHLTVAAARPVGSQAARGDSASGAWLREIRSRTLAFGGKTLVLGGSKIAWADADAVILPCQGTSLDTYRALANSRSAVSPRVGLWGHIRDYVSSGNVLDRKAERWQLRRADQVFAYTPSGAEYARKVGVDPSRVTTVMNSVDTDTLVRQIRDVTARDAQEFRTRWGLEGDRNLAFVGGLDSSKRIDFIAEFLDFLYDLDPSVKLLLGGRGAERHLLDKAVSRGQVIDLGHVDARTLATIGMVSAAIVMPGRVGLVAVDAMALGLPVVTTDWPFHAPEADYLVEGSTKWTAPNEPKGFATSVVAFLSTPRRTPVLRDRTFPTIDQMVDNFAHGVTTMMER